MVYQLYCIEWIFSFLPTKDSIINNILQCKLKANCRSHKTIFSMALIIKAHPFLACNFTLTFDLPSVLLVKRGWDWTRFKLRIILNSLYAITSNKFPYATNTKFICKIILIEVETPLLGSFNLNKKIQNLSSNSKHEDYDWFQGVESLNDTPHCDSIRSFHLCMKV